MLAHSLMNPTIATMTQSFDWKNSRNGKETTLVDMQCGKELMHHMAHPLLLVSSASVATEIYKTHELTFASRPPFIVDDEKLPYVGSSFINAPYCDYWKFIKKLCMTKLLGPHALELSRGVRLQELNCFLQKMFDSASSNKPIDLGLELVKLTNNTVCRMVMSTKCSYKDDEAEKCRKLVQETLDLAVKMSIEDVLGSLKWLGFWFYGKQAKDVFRRFDELIEDILKEHEDRREAKSRGYSDYQDLMDTLLDIYYDNQAEFKLTRIQIKAFILDLFIAATESSANAMQWAMAELINHPVVFKKVREEIDSVVGNSRLVEESDIPKLPYFQAVMKEILRLHPTATIITRQSREHCKIHGYDVPKKTSVLINLYAVMRDPQVWNDPNEFKPERFLVCKEREDSLYQEKEIEVLLSNFFTFGGGRRRCIGMMLSYCMMNATIAAMVQCFDWKTCGDGKETRIDMQVGKGMMHQLAHPLIAIPIARFSPISTME
ncbi:hypothetical protein ACH5RR_000719 [Cinchona calisaya]|uniref:Cytochrome P450 n=1 Tax=Cinchona calisaya TaxID=153742 RepID=A0ABD3B1I5_9GENT